MSRLIITFLITCIIVRLPKKLNTNGIDVDLGPTSDIPRLPALLLVLRIIYY